MTRGERARGRPWPPTTQAAITAVLASIFPFSFFVLPSLPPAVAPAVPNLPFFLLVLQLHIRTNVIAYLLSFGISSISCFD